MTIFQLKCYVWWMQNNITGKYIEQNLFYISA